MSVHPIHPRAFPLSISFLTPHNALDPRAFSGSAFFAAQALDAYLLLLPSQGDCTPIVVAEAMAMARPCWPPMSAASPRRWAAMGPGASFHFTAMPGFGRTRSKASPQRLSAIDGRRTPVSTAPAAAFPGAHGPTEFKTSPRASNTAVRSNRAIKKSQSGTDFRTFVTVSGRSVYALPQSMGRCFDGCRDDTWERRFGTTCRRS